MYRASVVLLTALAGLSGCGKELPPVPEPESRPAKLFTVSVGNNAFERSFPATTEAGDKAVLAFRVPIYCRALTLRLVSRLTRVMNLQRSILMNISC